MKTVCDVQGSTNAAGAWMRNKAAYEYAFPSIMGISLLFQLLNKLLRNQHEHFLEID